MAVCSWEYDPWWELADDRWVTEHRSILVRLDVECRALTDAEALDRYWEGCLDRGGPSRWASATTPVSCGSTSLSARQPERRCRDREREALGPGRSAGRAR